MAKQTYKVVLAGCGGMANGWVQTVQKIKDFQLVGFSDIKKEAAVNMATKYGFDASLAYDDLSKAIQATGADVVFDVTVPVAHDQVVITALKHGCHVLGEKPMSDSMDKARKMVATAKKAGKLYVVTQNYRYNPFITGLTKFLRSGKLGDIESLHAVFSIGAHFSHQRPDFRDVMAHPLILDMAIHTFDASRYISGCDPVAVYCKAFNPKHSWYKGDACAVAIFEFKNAKGEEVVFSYNGSWCNEGFGTDWNSQWRIVGEKGTVLWNGGSEIKAQVKKPSKKVTWSSEMTDVDVAHASMKYGGHHGLMMDFLAALKGGPTPQTHCEDNIKSLAMVHAAVASAESGVRVKVKW